MLCDFHPSCNRERGVAGVAYSHSETHRNIVQHQTQALCDEVCVKTAGAGFLQHFACEYFS